MQGAAKEKESHGQGDQIGRIFAYWTIYHFGQFFDDYKSRPNF
jgi:hypothetical protein